MHKGTPQAANQGLCYFSTPLPGLQAPGQHGVQISQSLVSVVPADTTAVVSQHQREFHTPAWALVTTGSIPVPFATRLGWELLQAARHVAATTMDAYLEWPYSSTASSMVQTLQGMQVVYHSIHASQTQYCGTH